MIQVEREVESMKDHHYNKYDVYEWDRDTMQLKNGRHACA